MVFMVFFQFAGLAGTVVKTYEFSHPVVERSGIYSIITFEGTHLLGEAGKATLPFYPVKLLLPPGETANSISIRYEKPVSISGEFYLLPRQEPKPISKGTGSEWLADQDFYSSSDLYPELFDPGVETHFYNGCGIAVSAFTPVRYEPASRKVTYYQSVTITVETSADPEAAQHQSNFYPSQKKADHLASLIQNPPEISRYYSGRDYRTDGYDYLIITSGQYVSEFDTLAAFYRPRGIETRIASTEYISTDTNGADLQEKIRNYIIHEYQENGIDYVLIGGDIEIVPYRGFYCYVISGPGYEDYSIPADLYYSALDGNWNTDGDGLWAEPDEDDLYPEVAVGRMSFSDTTELHNMLHKTMRFQDNPVEGELTRPLLAGEHLWGPPDETWGSDYLKLLVGLRHNNGYTTRGIPVNHPRDTLYDRYAYWSKATLIAHINSGRPWVHHSGHASAAYVMKLSSSDITNANFSQANGIDHNYTIVYTHGCICGAFDVSDCIGEMMVGIDNFAAAFIGNSRYGWFNQGTTDGPSQHLHREFTDAVYRDSLYHVGMAHLQSKSETAPFVDLTGEFEPGATRWCFYDNNVMGDPMMACWTEEPGTLAAQFPDMIPVGATDIPVQLSGPPGSYRNFTCSAYRNDTLFGTATTNSAGAVLVPLSGDLTEGQVSLIVSGYNIIPHVFDIHVCNYWLGWTPDWSNPYNWFTGNIPDSSSYIIIPANPAGMRFPLINSGADRQCRAIKIEPGALFNIEDGETFSVGAD
jgi:hypothetical protein